MGNSLHTGFRLLALDVDGTLIDVDGAVPPQTVDALARAAGAGMNVCLATGRSYVETMPVWRQLGLRPPHLPMVLIGGALVSDPLAGKTLRAQAIPSQLASAFAQTLVEQGQSAMAIVDSWQHDVEYLFVEGANASWAYDQWFSKMNVTIRRVGRLGEQLPPALRISAVVDEKAAPGVAGQLAERFAGLLNVHAILAPNYGVTIVEAFDAAVDKFAGLSFVASSLGIAPEQIVAVGDDVNDLAMIRGAGLGVAMSKAPPGVRQAADHVTTDGLASFIHELLDGRFDSPRCQSAF